MRSTRGLTTTCSQSSDKVGLSPPQQFCCRHAVRHSSCATAVLPSASHRPECEVSAADDREERMHRSFSAPCTRFPLVFSRWLRSSPSPPSPSPPSAVRPAQFFHVLHCKTPSHGFFYLSPSTGRPGVGSLNPPEPRLPSVSMKSLSPSASLPRVGFRSRSARTISAPRENYNRHSSTN